MIIKSTFRNFTSKNQPLNNWTHLSSNVCCRWAVAEALRSSTSRPPQPLPQQQRCQHRHGAAPLTGQVFQCLVLMDMCILYHTIELHVFCEKGVKVVLEFIFPHVQAFKIIIAIVQDSCLMIQPNGSCPRQTMYGIFTDMWMIFGKDILEALRKQLVEDGEFSQSLNALGAGPVPDSTPVIDQDGELAWVHKQNLYKEGSADPSSECGQAPNPDEMGRPQQRRSRTAKL